VGEDLDAIILMQEGMIPIRKILMAITFVYGFSFFSYADGELKDIKETIKMYNEIVYMDTIMA